MMIYVNVDFLQRNFILMDESVGRVALTCPANHYTYILALEWL
jgi:hypothetical protein